MPAQKPGRSKQNYGTPQDFLTAITRRLKIKSFTFDFACDRQNEKALHGWTEQDNSLSKPDRQWSAVCPRPGWGWLNPPYSNITPWAAKALGSLAQIAFLVPASVGSNWYRDFIHGQHGVQTLFLNGRLCFIEDWQHTINPATLKPGKGPARFYTSEPLYPKDCICVLFGTGEPYRADVWTWK